jgi:ubiquinone/menaquinone biosynthesis C-methylase UbiE
MQQLELKDKIREWWDDPSQDYDGFHGHGVNSDTEKELWGDEIMRILNSKRDPKVLDIGTGTGFLALLLSSKGYEVTAVDWSITMMQKAMDKAKAASLPIKFDVQDAESLTFADASFDAVVSRHVLWTLADPAKAAKEWARVIKPGGMIITDIPRQGSQSGKHHYGEDVGLQLPLGNGADPAEIVGLFKQAGLVNISLKLLEKQGEEHDEHKEHKVHKEHNEHKEHRKTILICGEKR